MKKSLVLFITLLALSLATGCKKKGSEGAKKASAMAGNVKKELGFTPTVTVAVNLNSLRKSSLYNIIKPKLTAGLSKNPCAKDLLDKVSALLVAMDNLDKIDDNTSAVAGVLKGAPVEKVIACMKSGKAKHVKEKVNGKEMDVIISEAPKKTKLYFFKGSENALVFGTENGIKALTPGKGVFGTGKIDSMVGGASLTFKVGAVKDMVKSAAGTVDLADGFKIDLAVEMMKEERAKKMVQHYEEAKKMPQFGDLAKNFTVKRSGATLTVTGSMSKKDIQKAMATLGPMLGGM